MNRDGVVKYAMGYTGGHTQLSSSILIEHALIHKPKPASNHSTLTKKGRAYLRAIMPTWGVLPALRASLDRAETDKAAAVDAERAVWVSAIEHYCDATAVMDVEQYADATREGGEA